MAKIKHDEIADKDLFGELGGSAKKAKIHINRLSKGLEDVVRVNKKIADQNKDPKTIQQINALSKASANINTSTKELDKTRKLSLSLDKQIQKERLAELKLQKDRERAFDRFEKQQQKNINIACCSFVRSRLVCCFQLLSFIIFKMVFHSASMQILLISFNI